MHTQEEAVGWHWAHTFNRITTYVSLSYFLQGAVSFSIISVLLNRIRFILITITKILIFQTEKN